MDRKYWTKALREAEQELEAATTRSAVNAAAKKLQRARTDRGVGSGAPPHDLFRFVDLEARQLRGSRRHSFALDGRAAVTPCRSGLTRPVEVLSSPHNFKEGMEAPSNDAGLSYLLDLDGWVSEVGGRFWIKISVSRTEAGGAAPHGLSYALTLHKPDGERVVGYDNAHPFAKRRGMRRTLELTKDHRHYRDLIEPYAFTSPDKLLEDFWADVERFLQEEGVTR